MTDARGLDFRSNARHVKAEHVDIDLVELFDKDAISGCLHEANPNSCDHKIDRSDSKS